MKPHKMVLKWQASVAIPLEKVYKKDKSCPAHLFTCVLYSYINRETELTNPFYIRICSSFAWVFEFCCHWINSKYFNRTSFVQTCLFLLPNKDPSLQVCVLTASCSLYIYSTLPIPHGLSVPFLPIFFLSYLFLAFF